MSNLDFILKLSAYLLLLFLFSPQMAILILLVTAIVFTIKYKQYKNCSYYKITRHPFLTVKRDFGKYGEYLTYKYLKKYEKNGARFLFNVYIPKGNEETTEIDVLMICSNGIFVFESKNYSGWIWGDESQKNWYQTLPKGIGRSHKECFYNPIMQNRAHIKHLKTLLSKNINMFPIIVFSDRCTLKNIQLSSSDIKVINRYEVKSTVADICSKSHGNLLTPHDIDEVYNKLYPCTQVDNTVKEKHISDIRNEFVNKIDPKAINNPIIVLNTENEELICPKCGGRLILRTAAKGANAGNQFYGCSNFPKCRYIKNIK